MIQLGLHMRNLRFICLLLTGGALVAQEATESNEVVLRPKAAPGPLDNPLKGYCVYTDAGKIRRPYSMVFLYLPWKKLEPAEGRYAFDEWEKKAWGARPDSATTPAGVTSPFFVGCHSAAISG